MTKLSDNYNSKGNPVLHCIYYRVPTKIFMVVNKDATEEVESLELEEELTIDDDGEIMEEEDFADIEGLGDHCVLEKHSLNGNSLDQGQYYLAV